MTIGNLFLLVILSISVLLGIAYILYRRKLKELKKKGYRDPNTVTSFTYWAFCTIAVSFLAAVFIYILCGVIANWNTPVL